MKFARSRPVTVFFGLSFLISGAAAGPLIASQHGWLPLPMPPFLGLLAAIGPGLAALATARLAGGAVGAKQLLRSTVRAPSRGLWYAFGLLFGPALLGTTYLLEAGLGGEYPRLAARLPGLVPLWLALTLQTGLGEELGWRGFAQIRLQQRLGPLRAALLVGVVWSVWHLALFLIPGSMQAQLAEAVGALAGVVGYSTYLVVSAVLYALALNASGSLLIPILLHGTTNATAWLFSLNDVAARGVRPMVILTVLQALVVTVWFVAVRKSA